VKLGHFEPYLTDGIVSQFSNINILLEQTPPTCVFSVKRHSMSGDQYSIHFSNPVWSPSPGSHAELYDGSTPQLSPNSELKLDVRQIDLPSMLAQSDHANYHQNFENLYPNESPQQCQAFPYIYPTDNHLTHAALNTPPEELPFEISFEALYEDRDRRRRGKPRDENTLNFSAVELRTGFPNGHFENERRNISKSSRHGLEISKDATAIYFDPMRSFR